MNHLLTMLTKTISVQLKQSMKPPGPGLKTFKQSSHLKVRWADSIMASFRSNAGHIAPFHGYRVSVNLVRTSGVNVNLVWRFGLSVNLVLRSDDRVS